MGTAGARGEIYVYGHAQPLALVLRPPKPAPCWSADVGGNRQEEITYLPGGRARGANLGWSCLEGSFVRRACRPPNYFPPSPPVPQRPRCGHRRLRGARSGLPSFNGRYLYGRYQSGMYASTVEASGRAVKTGAQVEDLSGFGQDGAGHLYATS